MPIPFFIHDIAGQYLFFQETLGDPVRIWHRTSPVISYVKDDTFTVLTELPIGWSVRFSACPILDADKKHTEFGIDPDQEVAMTKEDMQKGKDTIIEAAISRLLSGSELSEPDINKISPEILAD